MRENTVMDLCSWRITYENAKVIDALWSVSLSHSDLAESLSDFDLDSGIVPLLLGWIGRPRWSTVFWIAWSVHSGMTSFIVPLLPGQHRRSTLT